MTQWTEATREVMGYVLHYHSAKLSLATQALLEPFLSEQSLPRRLLRLDHGGEFILFIRSPRWKKRCIFTRGTDGDYVVSGLGCLQLLCWVTPWLLDSEVYLADEQCLDVPPTPMGPQPKSLIRDDICMGNNFLARYTGSPCSLKVARPSTGAGIFYII